MSIKYTATISINYTTVELTHITAGVGLLGKKNSQYNSQSTKRSTV
jgi:hypothetical protein